MSDAAGYFYDAGRRSDPAFGGDAPAGHGPSGEYGRQEQRRPRRAPNQYNIGYYGHASRLARWPAVATAPQWPSGHNARLHGRGAKQKRIPSKRVGRGKARSGQQAPCRAIAEPAEPIERIEPAKLVAAESIAPATVPSRRPPRIASRSAKGERECTPDPFQFATGLWEYDTLRSLATIRHIREHTEESH